MTDFTYVQVPTDLRAIYQELVVEAYRRADGHYVRAERVLNDLINAHPRHAAIKEMQLYLNRMDSVRDVRASDVKILKLATPAQAVTSQPAPIQVDPRTFMRQNVPRIMPAAVERMEVITQQSIFDTWPLEGNIKLGDAPLRYIAELAEKAGRNARGHLQRRKFFHGILSLAGNSPLGTRVRDACDVGAVARLNERVLQR